MVLDLGKKNISSLGSTLLGILLAVVPSIQAKSNVLFIMADDMRPQVHNANIDHYNTQIMKTPNLDRLASSGIKFDRAYAQISVCGATRLTLQNTH
jgi:arylsulfatase A-like enzyme